MRTYGNKAWNTERVVDAHLNGRRQTTHAVLDPSRVMELRADNPAVVEGRTIFPNRVTSLPNHVLVSGANQRKLGAKVLVGAWKGMPIVTLTLEERKTCPRDCEMFRSCYGNGMNFAIRIAHGPILEARLDQELWKLQLRHPGGFVVRPHILGDFYSLAYVELWRQGLQRYPALRVFGYTHRRPSTAIGAQLLDMRERGWDRFAMRFSGAPEPGGATVIARIPEAARVPEGIVCPIMTGKKQSCGECALCWSAKEDCIVFVKHGVKVGRPTQLAATAAP